MASTAARPPDNLGSLFGNTADEVVSPRNDTQRERREVPKSKIAGEQKTSADDEVRIAMIGNVDSGKSTLIGVLCGGMLDDGRGGARSAVFTHKHESCSGRTSAISHQLIGFNDNKQVFVGMKHGKLGKSYWNDLIKRTNKHMLLIDLCGHRKYLKTTIFGLTGLRPDFAIVLVGSNMGVPRMTREHIGIACALKIPIIVVITKVDICPPNIFKQTMTKLKRTLRTARKMPFVVNKKEKVSRAVELITTSTTTCPVFITSNVNGRGIVELRSFLAGLKKPQKLRVPRNLTGPASKDGESNGLLSSLAERPPVFQIDSTFVVPGVGLVLSGTLMQGEVALNHALLLGPDKVGLYRKVLVRGIHSNRVAMTRVGPGKSASFAIRSVSRKKEVLNRDVIRKGMVLIGDGIPEKCRATRVFEAEVLILHHQTTCGIGYTPVIHCGVVRQSAAILGVWKKGGGKVKSGKAAAATTHIDGEDDEDTQKLRTGDRATVRFRFCYYTEYIEVGTTLLFREGKAKGIGKIVRLLGNGEESQTAT